MDLIETLRLYIPIIKECCLGLERLSIIGIDDPFYEKDPFVLEAGWPRNSEDVLRPVLENELREIESLITLEVLGGGNGDQIVDYAQDTIDWIKERAQQKKRDAYRQRELLARIVQEVEVSSHCGFCGEGHIFA